MNPNHSISAAITRLVFGTAFVISLLFSLLVILYAWVIEDNIFNRLVAAEARHIEAIYLTESRIVQPRTAFMRLHGDWVDLPNEILPIWRSEPERVEFTLNNGKTLHIKVLVLGGQQYILTADVEQFEVTGDFITGVSFWLGAFGLLLCILLSTCAWWFAKRLLRPLSHLVEDLNNLPQTNIQPGFAQDYPDNEVHILAKTIEAQFIALDSALQRETHFTRDVSHEIRTPISIQKNILATASDRGTLSKDDIQALQESNLQLESITKTLLALARNESTLTTKLNLSECLENIILHHFQLNSTRKGQAVKLDLSLPENLWIETNQILVEILISNLISNAVNYATCHPCSIRLDHQGLSFENRYKQLPPGNVEWAGTKGSDSQGIGQGLNLIQRICDALGWQMTTTTKQGQFKVMIHFNVSQSQ